MSKINEALDTLLKLRELVEPLEFKKEKHDKPLEDVESLRLVIEEQRRDNDYLQHIYNRMRATESILLTFAFGITAYLYSNPPDGEKVGIAKRLFVPTEDYGKVIYFMAAGFFLFGVIKLMLNVFGNNPWQTSYESYKEVYNTEHEGVLKYIKKRYDTCQEYNSRAYAKRKNDLSFLFFCIVISAIILIVIKTLR